MCVGDWPMMSTRAKSSVRLPFAYLIVLVVVVVVDGLEDCVVTCWHAFSNPIVCSHVLVVLLYSAHVGLVMWCSEVEYSRRLLEPYVSVCLSSLSL